MQTTGERTIPAQMAALRLVCEREIPIQLHRIDSAQNFFRNILDSSKMEAQRTMQLQGKLGKLKGELREADDAFVKALSVKTRKEAKRMTMMESISVVKARVEELKRIVDDQRARKDEFAAIISQQTEALAACKQKCSEDNEHNKQVKEAISWYSRVLGFRIECGRGVKFIFTNINPANPKEEYFFTIRHENDTYTLLDCNPHLSDIKLLVNGLNKSNDLFKFARTMRMKFQEAAAIGASIHESFPDDQDSSMVSLSAPAASVSTDYRYETPIKYGFQNVESNSTSKNTVKIQAVRSPGSASSLRRSARLKGRN